MSEKAKKALSFLLFIMVFFLVVNITNLIKKDEIPYSQAMDLIENYTSCIESIVLQNNNKMLLTVNADNGTFEFVTRVPDVNELVRFIMELKTENDFLFYVKTPISEIITCALIDTIIVFTIIKLLKIVIKKFKNEPEPKSTKSTELPKIVKNHPLFSTEKFEEEIKLHIANEKITFEDVAGMESAKEALRDIATGILDGSKYEEYGIKIPSGILLEGNPGTGKTLLARALAGELDIPFIQFSATEMRSKWTGESEERIRQVFNYARENAPSIIFFDEIDSISCSRTNMYNYEISVINQLLTCLDGFTPRDGVIFIAATNFADSLDEAIKRPGRFDRIVHIDLPNNEEREAILKVHARNKKLSDEVDLKDLANDTAMLSGAHLASILNEAAILQMKLGHESITTEDINEAYRNVLFGPKNNTEMTASQKHLAAIHELGHAITSNEEIKEISIVARGCTGGYTLYSYSDKSYITSNQIKEELISYLGGRAAEQIMLNDISVGALQDMKEAWEMAHDYIIKYGMSSEMGHISIDEEMLSEAKKNIVFEETQKMISEAYEKASEIIKSQKGLIEELSKILEERETISGKEYYEMIKKISI